MYNAIDWESIKEQIKIYEDKKDKVQKIYNSDFQDLISFIINQKFNLERGSIYNEMNV